MRWRFLVLLPLIVLSLMPQYVVAETKADGYCNEEGNPVVLQWPDGGPDVWTPYCVGNEIVWEFEDYDFQPVAGDFRFPKPDDWAGWAFIKLNGLTVVNPYADVRAFVSEKTGRTLVPIRFVSEAMGAKVTWNGELELVSISWRDRTIELPIGENSARVNGQEVVLDQPAILFAQRTFVPLRFVAEAFGAEVRWDESAWIAWIHLDGVRCDPKYCPY